MKEYYAKELKEGMDLLGEFFIVRMSQIKVGSNGKKYLDILLGDKSGEITAKKWDVSPEEEPSLEKIKERDIVKVRGTITSFNNQAQVRIQRIRIADPVDEIEMSEFVKSAPEEVNYMFDFLHEKAEGFKDEDLRKIAIRVLDDNKDRLLFYPAASKNHHAELGGLLYHTKRMLMTAERVCEVYENLNRDLVMCGVILHDIAKLDEIDAEADGVATGYSFEGQLLGHIVMGIKYIDQLGWELGFSQEKRIMLEHMILSHHYEPEFGSPKKPLFPEAEVLHYLDILDARMFDMEDALNGVEPGDFSDRVWTLDNRRLYKPMEEK